MTKGKRDIGDPLDEVARTGKIGGRPSKSSDIQQSESSNLRSAEMLNTQTAESANLQKSNISDTESAEKLNTQTSEIVKGQNMNSLAVRESKGTHKGRTQKTIYLPPALAKQLNFAAVDEEREISEIVTDALEDYFKHKVEENN